MTYTTKIVNVETGEEIERNMNKEELAQFQADVDFYAAKEAEAITNAALRAEQKAGLLARLGITAEEAELLLS